MSNPNNFPGAKRGDRLTAGLLNRLVAQGRQPGRAGVGAGNTFQEPCFVVPVVNTTDDDIPAMAPVSLEESISTDERGLLNQRGFTVCLLEDTENSPVNGAVTVNLIPAGAAGEAYISGVCLARLTDDNASSLNAAGMALLWEAEDSGDRYAVVRIGGAGAPPSAIIIIGGQSLDTFNSIETFGIKKYTGGTLSGIPNGTYDPGEVNPTTGAETVAPTPAKDAWPDGLGYGTRWTGSSYERVIVCNDGRGTSSVALFGGADDDTTYAPTWRQERILSQRLVSVTKIDLSTVSAWSPDLS